MVKLVKQNKGIPVCVKTDAVVYYATKALDVSKYFWAEDVAKYKHEEFPNLLKRSIEYFHEDKFELKSMQYNVIEDSNEFNFNIDVAKNIIDSNQGCFLTGAAGTGKTKLQNEIVKLINDNSKIKKMAPTNVAAYLINGETIDKFIHTYLNNSKGLKKFKSIDYIFIDEVSMMKELFYSIFLSIKYLNPHIKFIISGDFAQLAPVNDRYNFNYEHSRALYELVDGNQLNLTFCRRTTKDGQTLFKLCQNIKNNQPYDITQLCNENFQSYKNICYTNKMRKSINNDCMKRYMQENPNKQYINVDHLIYDDNTQDYMLCEGMPLISRKNMKSMDVCNNEMFVCNKIKNDVIEISNSFKKLSIPIDKINKIFLIAFCITTHKSQGLTFDQPYCIHEYDKFDWRLKYVALSRATKMDHIKIAENSEVLKYLGII
jgi:hypothetical protein